MPNPLLQVPWEPCLLEASNDRAAAARVRELAGSAPPWSRYYASSPWLVGAIVNLSYDHALLVHVDVAFADLLSLAVSQEHSCRFCYAATRAALRIQGMSERRIEELEHRLGGAEVDARSAAAIAFTRRMARANPLATALDAQRLEQAGFTPDEVREIAFIVAGVVIGNRVFSLPAIPPDYETLPDKLAMRVLQPIMGFALRRSRRQGKPAPAVAAPHGPFSGMVRAYAGSPIAPEMARTAELMWASPVLTRRCKALMLAVIAKGLGCPEAVREMRPLLHADGLDDAAIDRALAHLGSPQLDATENRLLAFARDTIWYEPAAAQRRARQLRDALTREQFVEAIGVASVANGLCRLGAVVAPAP